MLCACNREWYYGRRKIGTVASCERADMAKRQRFGVLNRLAGKRLVFNGKFGYGAEESLQAMAAAQQGTVCDDVDEKVDYLVLADLNAGKTIQKKALALNGKGATIQVIDVDAFKALVDPADDEVLALLRGGESAAYAQVCPPAAFHFQLTQIAPRRRFCSESFSAAKLKHAQLADIQFVDCNFAGAELGHAQLGSASNCDFSQVAGESSRFGDVPGCRFVKATLNKAGFEGDVSGADFSAEPSSGLRLAPSAIIIAARKSPRRTWCSPRRR